MSMAQTWFNRVISMPRSRYGYSASHGVIVKTYSVTHLVKEAQGRYSPAAVVAVSKEVVSGEPDQYISTSYVERQNLSLRMGQRRFTRLTNGFSKKLDNHVAAVALYVAPYNLCRVHEAMAEEMKGRVVAGEGKEAEIDGGYFGGYVKPANLKEDRIDRRFARNQNGKRKVVIIIRERNGNSGPAVFGTESEAAPL